jgi:hypothetical protein
VLEGGGRLWHRACQPSFPAMTPHPAVLISLRRELPLGDQLERQLVDWVRAFGFEPEVAPGGPEAVAWVRERPYAASLFDWRVEMGLGAAAWRSIHAVLGRRLVLMAPEPRRDLLFEALGEGVGAVLPLPPRPPMVRAALSAATGDRWSSAAPGDRPV